MDIVEISAVMAAQHRAELQHRAARRRLLQETKAGSGRRPEDDGCAGPTRRRAVYHWIVGHLEVGWLRRTPVPSMTPRCERSAARQARSRQSPSEAPTRQGASQNERPSTDELVEVMCGENSRS